MIQRRWGIAVLATLIVLLAGAQVAEARKYKYGRYRAVGSEEQGFFLLLEGVSTNPRNTDAVFASSEAGTPIGPQWDDDAAGRLSFGYQWASGNRLWATVWGYGTDAVGSGTAGASTFFHAAIGPPIPVAGGSQADSFSLQTEIEAGSAELNWGKKHSPTEVLDLEWSLGLRYARFEETYDGTYGGIAGSDYVARKSNESEMFGAKAALRARFKISGSFSVVSSLGFSLLDGEIEALSSLTEVGASSPATFSAFVDDGRSGTIRDFDVNLAWNNGSDRLRIWVGWEQSEWEDISADLNRNFPGTTAPLRDRNSVTFSGFKLGLSYLF